MKLNGIACSQTAVALRLRARGVLRGNAHERFQHQIVDLFHGRDLQAFGKESIQCSRAIRRTLPNLLDLKLEDSYPMARSTTERG